MANAVTLPMPPMALRLMQDDDARLLQTGTDLAKLMFERGLKAQDSLLDIGSGYGRLALGLLHGTDFSGRYRGFDVLRKQVEWCATAITPIAPNFTFRHLDVRNNRYNPKGKVEPERVRFPAATATVDCCALFSIFTHFYRADIERYLREMRRVLKPGGIAVTTWFLFDDARLPAATASTAGYPMVERLDDVTIYAEAADPLRAIAYDEGFVRSMVAKAGLDIVTVDRGTWCNEPGTIFQDLVILRRSAGVRNDLRARAGHLKPLAAYGVRRARRLAHRVRTRITSSSG